MPTAPHYQSGDVMAIGPPSFEPSARTEVLIRDNGLEMTRIVLRSGERHRERTSTGHVVLQCIAGQVLVAVNESCREMNAGDVMYLRAGTGHSLSGVRDSEVLFVGMASVPGPVTAAQPDAVEEASLESFPASDPPAISTPRD